jgi:hypothetical protein
MARLSTALTLQRTIEKSSAADPATSRTIELNEAVMFYGT